MEQEPNDDQILNVEDNNRSQSEDEQQQDANRIRNRSSSTPHSTTERSILQKPSIPPILRSSSGPVQSGQSHEETPCTSKSAMAMSPAKAKRSSILKKKRQDGHGPTVSFELDPALSRAKSSDSNLSFESETGYWSGGSGGSGILKGCKSDSESSSSDGKSILKLRRASLGNLTSDHDPDSNELHSILKRKLSYDGSVLLNSTKSSQFSLSTNSLPTDMYDVSPEPKPILKNKFSSDELLDDNVEEQVQHTPRPILKNGARRNGTRGGNDEPIRPILKRSAHSIEKRYDDQSPSGKGILKRSSSNSRRQSGGSETLDPDDFDHESAVGFMLNPDDGLELRLRHSESPHIVRAGSTTPRSESEEEIIMLGQNLAEKRSAFKQKDSVSVDRVSKRRGRMDKRRSDARPLLNSDNNSRYFDLGLSVPAQMHAPKIELPEVLSYATFNTKGQLLSSILGEISDSHERRQQIDNFEHRASELNEEANKSESKTNSTGAQNVEREPSQSWIGPAIPHPDPNQICFGVEKLKLDGNIGDGTRQVGPIQVMNNNNSEDDTMMKSENKELELRTDRLSLKVQDTPK